MFNAFGGKNLLVCVNTDAGVKVVVDVSGVVAMLVTDKASDYVAEIIDLLPNC